MTASLLKSQGLFLIFWPISTSCSLDGLLFPSFSAPLLILWWIYQQCQLQLVSRSLSCFIGFVSVLLQGLSYILSFWFLSVLPCAKQERQSLLFGRLIIFYWLSLGLVVWGRIGEPFQKNIVRLILGYSNSFCSYDQISNFLHYSQWISFPSQLFLGLYSLRLHSLILSLIVLSLLPHKLYLLFCCGLSILALA